MQPYFISRSSLLTAIVSKSQLKQIKRTSSLLKIFHIFVQFVADDLFKHVCYHDLINHLFIYFYLLFFCLFAAERIILLEKKEIYNLYLDRVMRIWYLSPMRAAKVQASLRIHAVSPEHSLLAHTSRESRGTFRQKARSLAALNGWACAVKICHDGMLEDTNSLDGVHLVLESNCVRENIQLRL